MSVNLLHPTPFTELEASMTGKESRVYAIAFDMDIESLRTHFGDPYNHAYLEIRRVLEEHGFRGQQGSVSFGGSEINAVTCVLAAQDLARRLPWFTASVRDIRMLRIEEFNDLMPAVQIAGG
jgi:virulence-associated protein VapD